jgi:SPP1 family predicted phage head-tail adaptor
MIASQLKHLVTIVKDTVEVGERGQEKIVGTTQVCRTYASIEQLSQRRLELARQLVSSATHEITIRYISGVKFGCRVLFDGRTFNIGNVNNLKEVNLLMVLTCTEVQS